MPVMWPIGPLVSNLITLKMVKANIGQKITHSKRLTTIQVVCANGLISDLLTAFLDNSSRLEHVCDVGQCQVAGSD